MMEGSSNGASRPSSGGRRRLRGVKFPIKMPDPVQQPQPSSKVPQKPHSRMHIGGNDVDIRADDLTVIEELGRGAYGVVEKMKHKTSDNIMAVKRIRATLNSQEQKRLLMDLDVAMRSVDCEYTVTFYGALFRQGDVWICMEVMDTSLDQFYKKVKDRGLTIGEDVLGLIAVSIVKALRYLQETLHVIHRDVKPSNVLLNKEGQVKLCDFGISGQLVDSLAKTIDAGCKPYMAPERIDPAKNKQGYDVKSDVWSLGITMIEVATGDFPYDTWKNPFQQLKQVVEDPSPSLPDNAFSPELHNFCRCCLNKDPAQRPNYRDLEEHPFIQSHLRENRLNIASFISLILE
uniref:mitogen-activated protein kinase kinase n=1 Tax=Phallusia mammillata TaxID=59560 RepID=A0A6F9DKF5_9ASCI|nr:MAPKK3/6 dual specificity mitogen-activated protein kinase kinase 6 [Phallusia mammillata]